MTKKSVVVLISGAGSNLQAIIDDAAHQPDYSIVGVISNKSDAFGLIRARKADIPTAVIQHRNFTDREAFDRALIKQIDEWDADLVVLAGFMRILTTGFVQHYTGRLINIHPSLLPKHKGLDTHQRAIDAGETEHGCTVHFVSEEMDAGYPIIQSATEIKADDSAESLAERIHLMEHKIYPLAVSWFCSGRLKQTAEGALLDNELLGPSGYRDQSKA